MEYLKKIQKEAERAGLRAEEVSPGHVQILDGEFLVNYYPLSKRRTAYIAEPVNQTARHVSPEGAVAMAGKPKQVETELPVHRTPEEWNKLLPATKFAWRNH